MKSFLGGGGASLVLVLVAVSALINVANGLSCYKRVCGGNPEKKKCPEWDVNVNKTTCRGSQRCTAFFVTIEPSSNWSTLQHRDCYSKEDITLERRFANFKDTTLTFDCKEFPVALNKSGLKGHASICMCDKDFCNGKVPQHSGAGRLDSLPAFSLGLVGLLALTSTWGLLGSGAGANHS